ncbi:MAG: FAD-dependent oxidoreductase [Burkholderiaceae bacterium]|nr:FAD-dependent oxidoreductase [Burkholderiaceae bacterium]
MSEPIVVAGSGLAGYTLVRELRRLDASTPIVVVTRDDGAVYSKPMLSNALAAGRTAATLVTADAAGAGAQFGVTVLAGQDIESIDAAARTLHLANGERIAYRALVLALGADPIRVPLEGDGAADVLTVNDLADYARFRDAIETARSVTILGAGLIGCEFANDLRLSGRSVHVVEPAAWPLGRLVPQQVGAAMAQRLRAAGVELLLGTTATSIARRDGGGYRVRLTGDASIDTDVALSAIGLRPRTALAAAAGLQTNRGIVVDRLLGTSDPAIYALGDCAEVDGLVLSFVMPLMHAARALARTLCGEETRLRYPAMPVVVKTPAAPLTVAPPPAGASGTWECVNAPDGSLEASFVDAHGKLLGFALLGGTPAARQALARRLPAVLD